MSTRPKPVAFSSVKDLGSEKKKELIRKPIPSARKVLQVLGQAVPPTEMSKPEYQPPSLISADVPLTLATVEAAAAESNPSIAAAQAKLDSIYGSWLQSGLPPNPVVGYAAEELGGDEPRQGLFIRQQIIRGDKLQRNRQVASWEIEKQKQRLSTITQRVRTDVRLAFYGVLVSQKRVEITQEIVENSQDALSTVLKLHTAKESSKVDVLRSRLELQAAVVISKNARNAHDAAWVRLQSVANLEHLAARTLDGDLERVMPELNSDEVLARLTRESPKIAELLLEIDRAKSQVDRERAEVVPDVTVQAALLSHSENGGNSANLQVTMPLPWINKNQGGIRRAQAEVVAAERSVDRFQLHLRDKLGSVIKRYRDAQNHMKAYSEEGGILASAKEGLVLIQSGYQEGELGYLELLHAQRTFSQTHLSYIESISELWKAILEIEGMLLDGSLHDNPDAY